MQAFSRTSILVLGSVWLMAGAVDASDQWIMNGLAPPEPENIYSSVDDSLRLYVRNAGCLASFSVACSEPGDDTTVEIVESSDLLGLFVRDSSIVEITGGIINDLGVELLDSAEVVLHTGRIAVYSSHRGVFANGSSSLTQLGGTMAGNIRIRDTSVFTMRGGRLINLDGDTFEFEDRSFADFLEGEVRANVSMKDDSEVEVGGIADLRDLRIKDRAMGVVRGGTLEGASVSNQSQMRIESRAWFAQPIHISLEGSLRFESGYARGPIFASGESVIELSGPTLDASSKVIAGDDARVTVTGGTYIPHHNPEFVQWAISGDAYVEIRGSGFEVDGVAVPFGSIEALEGVLTGQLASGERIDGISFLREGPDKGTIALVEAVPAVEELAGGSVTIADSSLRSAVLTEAARLEIGEERSIRAVDAGGSSTIDLESGDISGALRLSDGAQLDCRDGGLTSTVSVTDSASIVGQDCVLLLGMDAEGTSSIELSGGRIQGDVHLDGSTTFALEGATFNQGSYSFGDFHAAGSSHLQIRDTRVGTGHGDIFGHDDATISLENIGGGGYGARIHLKDRSHIVVGAAPEAEVRATTEQLSSIWQLTVEDESTAAIHDPHLLYELKVWDSARATVYGHDLRFAFPGVVEGVDAAGEPFSFEYTTALGGEIAFALPPEPVPEPGSRLLQAVALLVIAVAASRRSRQRIEAASF